MGYIIFISYSRLDEELYNIPYIAEELKQFPEINDVLFYEGADYSNIIEYMNNNIKYCNIFLSFCSKNANESGYIKMEWQAALFEKKHIIPVFVDINEIPTLLKPYLGVKFIPNELSKNVEEIYATIQKWINKKIKIEDDLYNIDFYDSEVEEDLDELEKSLIDIEEDHEIQELKYKEINEEIVIDVEDEVKIINLAKDPLVQKKIIQSIAPGFHGFDKIKLSCALCLFGGNLQAHSRKFDSEISILFVPDPGTKTYDLLKDVAELYTPVFFTSGKGSGKVLFNNTGLIIIDNLEKLDKADEAIIREIKVKKLFYDNKTKKGRLILAVTTPYYGKYNYYKTFTNNVRVRYPLLSLFDLIFVILDKPSLEKDTLMVESMLDTDKISNLEISTTLLKKYIKYARNNCYPVLNDEAKALLKSYYLALRGKFDVQEDSIGITLKTMESLIKLSEAHAKMSLRNEVIKEDVEKVKEIFDRFLEDTGIDSGKMKIDPFLIEKKETNTFLKKINSLFEKNEWHALNKLDFIEYLKFYEKLHENWIKKKLENLINDKVLIEKENYLQLAEHFEIPDNKSKITEIIEYILYRWGFIRDNHIQYDLLGNKIQPDNYEFDYLSKIIKMIKRNPQSENLEIYMLGYEDINLGLIEYHKGNQIYNNEKKGLVYKGIIHLLPIENPKVQQYIKLSKDYNEWKNKKRSQKFNKFKEYSDLNSELYEKNWFIIDEKNKRSPIITCPEFSNYHLRPFNYTILYREEYQKLPMSLLIEWKS